MNTAETIRGRRLALDMTEVQAAARCGLTVDSYYDLESYDDEFTTALPLSVARKVCSVLGLELRSLLGLPSPGKEDGLQAHDLIRAARERLGWSQADLENRMKYTKRDAVAELESDPKEVDREAICDLMELERELGLPSGALIG